MKAKELQSAKLKLKQQIQELQNKLLETESPAMQRQLKIQIAILQEKLGSANYQLVSQNKMDKARQRREAREWDLEQERQAIRNAQAELEEERKLYELIDRLKNRMPDIAVGCSLEELGNEYKLQADLVRHKINILKESKPKDNLGKIKKERELQLLKEIHRDLQSVARICLMYHKKGFRPNGRLCISGAGYSKFKD